MPFFLITQSCCFTLSEAKHLSAVTEKDKIGSLGAEIEKQCKLRGSLPVFSLFIFFFLIAEKTALSGDLRGCHVKEAHAGCRSQGSKSIHYSCICPQEPEGKVQTRSSSRGQMLSKHICLLMLRL